MFIFGYESGKYPKSITKNKLQGHEESLPHRPDKLWRWFHAKSFLFVDAITLNDRERPRTAASPAVDDSALELRKRADIPIALGHRGIRAKKNENKVIFKKKILR